MERIDVFFNSGREGSSFVVVAIGTDVYAAADADPDAALDRAARRAVADHPGLAKVETIVAVGRERRLARVSAWPRLRVGDAQ
jgi:hypothetical protein